MRKNKKRTSEMQKKAVNGILSGKSPRQAMISAGYTVVSASHPKQNLIERRGVQSYVAKLDKASQEKFGMSLESKMIDTSLEGLEAKKLYGKNVTEAPDWGSRFNFLKLLSEVTGISKSVDVSPQTNQQFNFFSVGKEEQDIFNSKLKEFLKKSYAKE